MKKAKEIVVISGKGGTGKTTITASLAGIMTDKVIVDADVDAANLYILLRPQNIRGTDFTGKGLAEIDRDLCVHCGLCKELCRFFAIEIVDGDYRVDPFSCDGCGLCKIVCPVQAVTIEEQVVGKWFSADTEFGAFVYARLIPGAENSGNLVTMVKEQAKQKAAAGNIPTILIDGPPGIGCPVISAVSGADFALIVTEPTYSGISDLRRVFDLTAHFGIKSGIVINRCDINPGNTTAIETFAREKGIPVLAGIPHSRCIMDEISESRLPARKCKELSRQIENIYEHIKTELLNE
ncbi:MAG: ATP-binding protein [Candidatus Aminicenantes bacterium]|nr:ATP-binding protein [Candidatus Aminicenantes bacterium]